MTVELEQKLQKRLDEAVANREIQQVSQVQVQVLGYWKGIERVLARVIAYICGAMNPIFSLLTSTVSLSITVNQSINQSSSSGQDQDPAEWPSEALQQNQQASSGNRQATGRKDRVSCFPLPLLSSRRFLYWFEILICSIVSCIYSLFASGPWNAREPSLVYL